MYDIYIYMYNIYICMIYIYYIYICIYMYVYIYTYKVVEHEVEDPTDVDGPPSGVPSFAQRTPIGMLTLLLMSLAGLHFCVGLNFVTPLVVIYLK
jgi:hypothetical protein